MTLALCFPNIRFQDLSLERTTDKGPNVFHALPLNTSAWALSP